MRLKEAQTILCEGVGVLLNAGVDVPAMASLIQKYVNFTLAQIEEDDQGDQHSLFSQLKDVSSEAVQIVAEKEIQFYLEALDGELQPCHVLNKFVLAEIDTALALKDLDGGVINSYVLNQRAIVIMET